MRQTLLALICLGVAASVDAQTTITASTFRLSDGPCTVTSLNGTPDKLVIGSCPFLTTPAATNLTIGPTGDLILGPTGRDILPDVNYTQNLGALSNKYLTLHAAELWVETLVAQNTIATIGGRVLVAPTTTLTSDVASGSTSIVVKHNEMVNGDRVYLEANGKVEFMAITSAASGVGPYTYTVTRNLDGSGANDWYAGDAVLNTGTTGDGFIDLYSLGGVLGGAGPAIVGNVRTGTTYNNIDQRWAIGNLNGLYGYGVTTYGAAFGDAANTNVTIDATNGLRIRHGATNKLAADTFGNLSLAGDLSMSSTGAIRSSSASSFSTGDGFYLIGGASPKFRIGNPAGNQLTYETSSGILTVSGNGGGLTAIGPGSLTVGMGRNRIRNADCAASTAGWTSFTTSAGSQVLSFNAAGYHVAAASNTCNVGFLSGSPANGTYSGAWTGPLMDVVAGNRYEASAYLAVFNSPNAYVAIEWLSADGTTAIGVSNASTCSAAGGLRLVDYCRTGVIATAPTNSYTARVWMITQHNGSATPYIFWNHAYFGEATSGQTELTPWGPAGVTSIVGGVIETGTITAVNIAASTITADKLSVSTLSAITANIGTVTAGTIDGVTGIFGSGNEVTLDNSGVSITAGNGTANKVKWSGGSSVFEYAGSLNVTSNGDVSIAPTGNLLLGSGLWYPNAGNGATDIGTSSVRMKNIYTIDLNLGSGTITKSGWGGSGSRYLCVDNSGVVSAAAFC